MKKLILFVCICVLAACKGENKSATMTDTIITSSTEPTSSNLKLTGLTNYKWVLESAIVTPVITINGKTSSNYLELQGEGSCLTGDYTYVFLENGIYQNFSTGANCRMPPNSDDQKWSVADNKITLTNRYGSSNPFIFNGNTITQTGDFVNENVNYTIAYTYKPVKIKD